MTALLGALGGTASGAATTGAIAAASTPLFSKLLKTGATLGQASSQGAPLGTVLNSMSSLFGKEGLSDNKLNFFNQIPIGGDRLPTYEQVNEVRKPYDLMSLFAFLSPDK